MVRQVREISFGDDFGEVIVGANGSRVVIHANGSVDACTAGANLAGLVKKNAPPQVGEAVGDTGVFIGSREFRDGAGKSLGVYDLYAAPEDLKGAFTGNRLRLTFNDAVKHVAGLLNWHGHDGGDFGNEEALLDAMRSGRYKGEWFLPSKALLQDLEKIKSIGALGGTFNASAMQGGSGFADWYWSSTEHPNDPSLVYVVYVTEGVDLWVHKDSLEMFARVVRAELKPSVV